MTLAPTQLLLNGLPLPRSVRGVRFRGIGAAEYAGAT